MILGMQLNATASSTQDQGRVFLVYLHVVVASTSWLMIESRQRNIPDLPWHHLLNYGLILPVRDQESNHSSEVWFPPRSVQTRSCKNQHHPIRKNDDVIPRILSTGICYTCDLWTCNSDNFMQFLFSRIRPVWIMKPFGHNQSIMCMPAQFF